jgi:N-glycosylase/DNA lyase
MEYIVNGNNILINRLRDFDIEHILECGQCFRFYKSDNKDYILIAFNKILRVTQEKNKVIFHHTNEQEFNEIWIKYFDLKRNYKEIKNTLSTLDKYLDKAVNEKSGIRILQQEIWETLISFILSQNNNINRIKILIERLSKKYGTYIGEQNSIKYYSFPTVEQLSKASEQDLRDLKVGFRAPYIVDACFRIINEEVNLNELFTMEIQDAKKELIKIKGVGPKVADCVLLFGAKRYEVFPTDVWVKRIMEYYYFDKDTKIKEIHEFATGYYGHLAGFAQQYLFYYARDLKVGKK